jgi:hypothetical protein
VGRDGGYAPTRRLDVAMIIDSEGNVQEYDWSV